jgi:hypothetical protein
MWSHHAQILAPRFASHNERNDPTQEASSIPGVFGDEAGAAHN